jgi:hypothetical protein
MKHIPLFPYISILVGLSLVVAPGLFAIQGASPENFTNFTTAVWYRGFSPAREIVTARTLNTKVFAGEQGKRIYRIFSHPVHRVTERGVLEDLPDSCGICESWQPGESFGGYADGLFEELNVCGQSATYIQINETYFLRGFVEFNTDVVPDTTLIDSLTLFLNCAQWPIYSEDHDIWSMEARPSSSTAMGIYYDAMDGDCYVDNYLGGTGWNSWVLDSVAKETFMDQLADDWFAVGISDFQSASAYFLLYQCSSGYLDAVELGIAEEKPEIPAGATRLSVQPNPFSSVATIHLAAPPVHGTERLVLYIYDVVGREVRRFELAAGSSHLATDVVWDGRDHSGNYVSSGTYLCTVQVGKTPVTKRLLFIR